MAPPLSLRALSSSILRTAACATTKAARMLRLSIQSRCSSVTASNGSGMLIPALLIRMSSLDSSAMTFRTRGVSVTSQTTCVALPPISSMRRATRPRLTGRWETNLCNGVAMATKSTGLVNNRCAPANSDFQKGICSSISALVQKARSAAPHALYESWTGGSPSVLPASRKTWAAHRSWTKAPRLQPSAMA